MNEKKTLSAGQIQWQYSMLIEPGDARDALRSLDTMGRDGWEAYALTVGENGVRTHYLKRPVTIDPPPIGGRLPAPIDPPPIGGKQGA